MDKKAVERAVARIAHEIIERNRGVENLVLLGIPTRGYRLAEMISTAIARIEGTEVAWGAVDATLYRDDLSLKDEQPPLKKMEIPVSIDGKRVVMVDDVLYTGRTIRAAMNALMDFGRPTCIQLAVLIDRGHRELPIKADYVGKNLPTSREQGVRVRLDGTDDSTEVLLVERTGAAS
jgi:pyrimidine operon attenuation protein/uracil phosphoribosyltransferase